MKIDLLIEYFDNTDISLEELTKQTLAYSLADNNEKELLIELFTTIKLSIETKIAKVYNGLFTLSN